MSARAASRRALRAGFALSAATALAVFAVVALAAEDEGAPAPFEVDGRKSGYLFMSEGTRALQDDDFQNPGMFEIDAGRALWERVEGSAEESCASCHGDAAESMRGVAARYPVYDEDIGRLMNLELRINQMRTEHMGAEPFRYESGDMLALATYIAYQSQGMAMAVAVDGPAEAYFDQGRDYFYMRQGQLNLACSHCHEDLVDLRLRGDRISQGHVNGFPIYRLMWSSMASRHRMFQWCNTSLRAEPHEYGSEDYLALELYLAWRGRGLPIEAPAVRR